MRYAHILSWLFLFFSPLISTYAQNASSLSMSVPQEVEIGNTKWETILVEINNNQTIDFSGVLHTESPEGIDVIGSSIVTVEVKGNKKRFQPVRLRVKESQKSGTSQVVFILKQGDEIIQKAETDIVTPEYRRVRVLAKESNILMQHVGDSIKLETHIVNLGNQAEELEIAVSIPKDLEYRHLPTQKILLPAFKDTIITYRRLIDKKMIQYEQFFIQIAVLNKNMEFVGNATFQIQNTASSRRYVDPEQYRYATRGWSKNQLNLGIRDIGERSQSYTVQARADVPIEKSQVSLNTDVIWWENSHIDPLMTNTWIAYKNQNIGVHLGNIHDNDSDIYISGTGVSVTNDFKNSDTNLSIGFADRSYNLLNSLNDIDQAGYNLFAKVKDIKTGKVNHNIYYVFDKKFDNHSHLVQDRFQWIPNEKWSLNISTGLSNSKYDVSDTHISKNSAGLDLGYTGEIGMYKLRGRNSWSSPYYPGIRRGILAFNNRVSRQKGRIQYWLHTNYNNNNPKFVHFSPFNNGRESHSISTGVNSAIKSRVRYSISPEYYNETGTFYGSLENPAIKMRMKNLYLHTNISWYPSSNNHGFILNLSQGVSHLSASNLSKYVNKASLSWNHKILNANLMYQYGGFFLSETAFNYLHNNNKLLERWSASLNYNQNFFNNKFQANAQLVYQKDNSYGTNWIYSATGSLMINQDVDIYAGAQGYYYKMDFAYTPNILVRAGVNIRLPEGRRNPSVQTGDLDVFVFYDTNNNNKYDEDEFPASDRLVQINNVNFATDNQGNIHYKKVPYGDYALKVKSNQWYNINQHAQIDKRKNQVVIPLQKTGTLRGKINLKELNISDESLEGTLAGIQIVLTDSNGKEWNTRTDDNGNYSVYLPTNTYQISIISTSLPRNTILADELPSKVEIIQSNTTILDTIYIEAKKRNIEIKRFGQ